MHKTEEQSKIIWIESGSSEDGTGIDVKQEGTDNMQSEQNRTELN